MRERAVALRDENSKARARASKGLRKQIHDAWVVTGLPRALIPLPGTGCLSDPMLPQSPSHTCLPHAPGTGPSYTPSCMYLRLVEENIGEQVVFPLLVVNRILSRERNQSKCKSHSRQSLVTRRGHTRPLLTFIPVEGTTTSDGSVTSRPMTVMYPCTRGNGRLLLPQMIHA